MKESFQKKRMEQPMYLTITKREEIIVRRTARGETLNSTAILLGISRERVRQIDAKIKAKLRHANKLLDGKETQ